MPLDGDLTEYTTVSPIVPTVSISDIITGVGYKRWFATNGSNSDFLTTESADSASSKTLQDVSISESLEFEKNYDLEFANVGFIEGRCIVNYSFGGNSAGGQTGNFYTKTTLMHVDGASVESTIGSTVTTATITPAGGTGVDNRYCIDFDVTKKKFIPGEKFRLNIEVWGSKDGGNCNAQLYHDPTNRVQTAYNSADTGTTNDTDLTVDIPFNPVE